MVDASGQTIASEKQWVCHGLMTFFRKDLLLQNTISHKPQGRKESFSPQAYEKTFFSFCFTIDMRAKENGCFNQGQ